MSRTDDTHADVQRPEVEGLGGSGELAALEIFASALDRAAPRAGKPRRRGLTSLLDYGPGLHGWTTVEGVSEFLALCADFIDTTKIGGLNAIMLPSAEVKRMSLIYRDHGIPTYSGGLLFEFACQTENLESLPRLLGELEIGGVEISENYRPLADDVLADAINRLRRHGLNVTYEFGRKSPDVPFVLDDLRRKRDVAFDAGADHVVIEYAELALLLRHDAAAWRSLCNDPSMDGVFIELDPTDFPASHIAALDQAGPNTNLSNVTPQHLLAVERLRRGVGYGADCPLLEKEL